ncbi:MAG: SDR family NAD(P)-dependent oxidoreductase, partial [Actinomycetota bacterium]
MLGLEGKPVLITGGAGGIGFATARRFLEAGSQVTLLDRGAEAGRRVLAGDGGVILHMGSTNGLTGHPQTRRLQRHQGGGHRTHPPRGAGTGVVDPGQRRLP